MLYLIVIQLYFVQTSGDSLGGLFVYFKEYLC